MAAKSDTIHTTPGEWVLISDGPVDLITVQNQSGGVAGVDPGEALFIHATADAVAPVSMAGAARYLPNDGAPAMVLADVFLGVSGAGYVWAYSASYPVPVMVQHA